MLRQGLTGLLCFFIIAACSAWQNKATVTADDTLKDKTVLLGKVFTVKLGECVGCEHGWSLKTIDNVYLAERGSKLKPHCRECDGGNGDRIFTFKAIKRGTTFLEFQYGENTPVRMKVTIK